jgi:hypothetical protein
MPAAPAPVPFEVAFRRVALIGRYASPGIAEPLIVKGGRRSKAALNDHAPAVAELIVTGSAEDVEPLLASLQNGPVDREGIGRRVLSVNPAGIELIVQPQLAARHRSSAIQRPLPYLLLE